MSRSLLLVYLLACIFLSACASARAEGAARQVEPVQASITGEASLPNSTDTKHSPSPTADLAGLGVYSSSVLAADGGGEIETVLYPLDPSSGEAVPGYEPLPLGLHYAHAFSPDGRTLALVTFLSSKYDHPHSLVLLDLGSWQEEVFNLKLDSYVRGLAFSPDGRKLAILFGDVKSIVMNFDRDLEAVTAETTLDFLATRFNYTRDGQGLMLYGPAIENRFSAEERSAGPPSVLLLDAGDLSQQWRASVDGLRDGIYPKDEQSSKKVDLHQPGAAVYYFPGMAFAPDRDALYAVHPDQERLTRVDFAARTVETVEIRPRLTWFERLLSFGAGVAHAKVADGTDRRVAISPDGELLYIIGKESEMYQDDNGDWQARSKALGLQVVRTADGVQVGETDSSADQLSISADGSTLYLFGWEDDIPWTVFVDTALVRETITRLEGMWLRPGYRMDGEALLLASDWIGSQGKHHIAVADPGTHKLLNEWTSARYLAWLSTQ